MIRDGNDFTFVGHEDSDMEVTSLQDGRLKVKAYGFQGQYDISADAERIIFEVKGGKRQTGSVRVDPSIERGFILIGTGSSAHMQGGNGPDVIFAEAEQNTIFGLGGDDTIIGDDSSVVKWVYGGEGDDVILVANGGSGPIDGNEGDDYIRVGGPGRSSIYAGEGNDKVIADQENGSKILGGSGDDHLEVRSGNGNKLLGEDGNDRLYGGGLSDILMGGPRDDMLVGGAGDDVMYGSVGFDRFVGGAGNDLAYDRDLGNSVADVPDPGSVQLTRERSWAQAAADLLYGDSRPADPGVVYEERKDNSVK